MLTGNTIFCESPVGTIDLGVDGAHEDLDCGNAAAP